MVGFPQEEVDAVRANADAVFEGAHVSGEACGTGDWSRSGTRPMMPDCPVCCKPLMVYKTCVGARPNS
jgi:hypothetical protein